MIPLLIGWMTHVVIMVFSVGGANTDIHIIDSIDSQR
jgi:hypothetical protein